MEQNFKTLLNRFSLHFFDAALEQRYRAQYRISYVWINRLCMLIATILYAGFGIIDFYYGSSPQSLETYQTIRYGIAIPTVVLLFILSLQTRLVQNSQILFIIALVAYTISITAINVIASSQFQIIYLFGFLFLFIFGQNFLKILYIRSLIVILLGLSVYVITVLLFRSISFQDVFVSLFFLAISLIISTLSSYYFEYMDRKKFWIQEKLTERNEQFQQLQKELEQKVLERTQKLEELVQELEQTKDKIEESNRIKTTFLSTISHEIRTPLTSILGFSQLIMKAAGDAKTQKYAETIEMSIQQLLEIVNKILTLSEIENNRVENSEMFFDSHHFMNHLKEIAANILDKRNKNLQFVVDSPQIISCKLSIGEKDLLIVLHHLLDNAVKYTGSGSIGVSCTKNQQGMLQICVFDTGIGISNDHIHSVFEFFRQEDQHDSRVFNGIGVGLSICKGIITKVGGSIWAESEKNKGSRFYVTVPIIG